MYFEASKVASDEQIKQKYENYLHEHGNYDYSKFKEFLSQVELKEKTKREEKLFKIEKEVK